MECDTAPRDGFGPDLYETVATAGGPRPQTGATHLVDESRIVDDSGNTDGQDAPTVVIAGVEFVDLESDDIHSMGGLELDSLTGHEVDDTVDHLVVHGEHGWNASNRDRDPAD